MATSSTVSVKITGNATEAIAALEALGIKAEETGAKAEAAFGDQLAGKLESTGGLFSKLGSAMASIGLPFSSSVSKMGEKVGEAETKGKAFGQTLAAVGKVATVAGVAGLAVAGAESVKMAQKFQSSMELLHTQAGVPQAAIKGLSNSVLALAGPTATAPDELSTALYHLASNGLRGQQAMDALKTAAEGAKVGHANLEDVTNALGAVIASNIPGVKNYSEAMGVMNATVGAGDMKMQDLADAFGTGVLASVKGFGVNIKDVGAALATFGDNNIRGAQAGTELRMSVQALAKPAATGKAALAGIGLSMTQLGTDLQKGGLKQAINDLQDHLKAAGDTGSKEGEVLTEAFGKKAGVGINVLVGQVDRFNSKFGEVDKGAASFGEDWKATTKTFSFQMDQLKSTVEALGIKFGTFLIPKLEDVGKVIAKVTMWFEQHRAVAIAVAAVIGGALVTAILAYVVSMGMAAVATIAATWPIMLIVAAVAAVIAGIVLLYENWSTVWNEIKRIAGDVWHAIDSDFVQPIEGFFTAIPKFIEDHWKLILAILTGPIGLAISWITTHFHTIVDFFTKIPGEISDAIGDLGSIGSKIITDIVGGITSIGHTIWDWFKSIPQDIINAIGDLSKIGEKIVKDIIHGITSAGGGIVSAIASQIPGAGIVKGALSTAGSIVSDLNPFSAEGGYFNGAQWRIVGEAGPEVILPLSNPTRMAEILRSIPPALIPKGLTFPSAAGATTSLSGLGGGGGGAPSVSVTHNIIVQSDISQGTYAKLNVLLDQHDQKLKTALGVS